MNSYYVAFVISVIVNIIEFTSSRELILLNTLNSQHVVFPIPYLSHFNCRYYQPIVCRDLAVRKYGNIQQVIPPSGRSLWHPPESPLIPDTKTQYTVKVPIYQIPESSEIKPNIKSYKLMKPKVNQRKRNSFKNVIFDKNMLSPYRSNRNKLENSYEFLKTRRIVGNRNHGSVSNQNIIANVSSPAELLVPNKVKDISIIEQKIGESYEASFDNLNKRLNLQTESSENCPVRCHESGNQNRTFYNSNAYPLSNGVLPLDDKILYEKFKRNVDQLERKFYQVSFDKLSANSPPGRQENGISFAQSALFLHIVLMVLSTAADAESKIEIENCLKFNVSDVDRKILIHYVLSSLPFSGDELKFRWSTRLILGHDFELNDNFKAIAKTMQLKTDNLNSSANPSQIINFLNDLVELDSGGAMHNTFDEDDISNGVSAVMISMLYIRGRWRSAPTLLNGTRIFRDVGECSERSYGAIRINDIMRYAEFNEWDAEAIEISYATPGLTLLLLVPRATSLRRLTQLVTSTSVDDILRRMHSLRVAVTLPLYTLRMTLLLPSKLDALGVTKLLDTRTKNDTLKLSHAIQRIMFWSEAGRHAFKDDGIEWDDHPELELVVDRPYIFFVRWNDLTILTGNFVL